MQEDIYFRLPTQVTRMIVIHHHVGLPLLDRDTMRRLCTYVFGGERSLTSEGELQSRRRGVSLKGENPGSQQSRAIDVVNRLVVLLG